MNKKYLIQQIEMYGRKINDLEFRVNEQNDKLDLLEKQVFPVGRFVYIPCTGYCYLYGNSITCDISNVYRIPVKIRKEKDILEITYSYANEIDAPNTVSYYHLCKNRLEQIAHKIEITGPYYDRNGLLI